MNWKHTTSWGASCCRHRNKLFIFLLLTNKTCCIGCPEKSFLTYSTFQSTWWSFRYKCTISNIIGASTDYVIRADVIWSTVWCRSPYTCWTWKNWDENASLTTLSMIARVWILFFISFIPWILLYPDQHLSQSSFQNSRSSWVAKQTKLPPSSLHAFWAKGQVLFSFICLKQWKELLKMSLYPSGQCVTFLTIGYRMNRY